MFHLNKIILQSPIIGKVDNPVSDFQCLQSLRQLKRILKYKTWLKNEHRSTETCEPNSNIQLRGLLLKRVPYCH